MLQIVQVQSEASRVHVFGWASSAHKAFKVFKVAGVYVSVQKFQDICAGSLIYRLAHHQQLQ